MGLNATNRGPRAHQITKNGRGGVAHATERGGGWGSEIEILPGTLGDNRK